MTKRLHILALAIAGVLAVTATSVAATTGVLAFNSSPRSTVAPPPKTKKPQRPQAAKVKALTKAVTAAKAKVRALEKLLAKATTPAQKNSLRKQLALAKAKVKALEKALQKAKLPTCTRGYRLVKGKCVRV
jgi:hypothetical protein